MLDVKNINLYYGAAQALRGVSISAEPGKVTCVLGRNGVGKTSLLRAMVGQYPIASGSITFDGADITGVVRRCELDHPMFKAPFQLPRTVDDLRFIRAHLRHNLGARAR